MNNSKKEHSEALLSRLNAKALECQTSSKVASPVKAVSVSNSKGDTKDSSSTDQDGETTKKRKRVADENAAPDTLDESEAAAVTTDAEDSHRIESGKRRKTQVIDQPESNDLEVSLSINDKKSTEILKGKEDLLNSPSKKSLDHSALKHPVKYVKNKQEMKSKSPKRDKRKSKQDVDFMKIGALQSKQKTEVVRVLPYWLSHPRVIGQKLVEDGCAVRDLSYLHPALLTRLEQDGINRLFPVQRKLIPEILSQASCTYTSVRASDLCVSAATGSGKTLAYVLPVLHAIENLKSWSRIRALVILPTEQLATQVLRVFSKYGKCVGVNVGSAIGSIPMKQEQSELVVKLEPWELQLQEMGSLGVTGGGRCKTHRSLVHVVVATPDRLKDHMALTPAFDLAFLRYLIFDEADRLMSGDGGQWINSIVQSIREQQDGLWSNNPLHQFGSIARSVQPAHKLLVSATLSCDPEKLDTLHLFDPVLFTTPAADPASAHEGGKSNAVKSATTRATLTTQNEASVGGMLGSTRPATLEEQFIVVEQTIQPLMLHHLISSRKWPKTLVFTHTKDGAHNLAVVLQRLAQQEYTVGEFSARIGSYQKRMADNFKKGAIHVLVCTDSLSRGIDFSDIGVVVNYDATQCGETYVHRVGRTARAGKEGLAVTMLHSRLQEKQFRWMTSQSGSSSMEEMEVDIGELHPFQQRYKDALEALKQTLEREKIMGHRKSIQNYVGVSICKQNPKQQQLVQ